MVYSFALRRCNISHSELLQVQLIKGKKEVRWIGSKYVIYLCIGLYMYIDVHVCMCEIKGIRLFSVVIVNVSMAYFGIRTRNSEG
jgi:hypothetical protein